MFETGVVRANECYSLFQVSRYNRNIISISFDIKVYYVLSLELPHFGDSQKYKQHTIINIKKRKSPNNILYTKFLQLWVFCYGLNNKFEITIVNQPLVFEPLKFF